MKLKQK